MCLTWFVFTVNVGELRLSFEGLVNFASRYFLCEVPNWKIFATSGVQILRFLEPEVFNFVIFGT